MRLRNSSIFQTFFKVSINFILSCCYNVTTSPPAASIASFAEAVNLCADTFIFAFISPLPKIFTISFLPARPKPTKVSQSTVSLIFLSSTNCCRVSILIPLYSLRLMFVNPNLGTRRCRGICPPSNPNFLEYPERDFAPLCPRVAVPPFPEPCPRPTRLPLFFAEPAAGCKLLKSIFYCVSLFGFNRNQVINFIDHTKNIWRILMFNRLTHLAQAKCFHSSLLVFWAIDNALYLCYFNFCHRSAIYPLNTFSSEMPLWLATVCALLICKRASNVALTTL